MKALLVFLAASRTASWTMFRTSRIHYLPYFDISDAWDEITHQSLSAMNDTFSDAMAEARSLWQAEELETPLHPSTIRQAMESAQLGNLAMLKRSVERMERSLEPIEAALIRQACPEAFEPVPPLHVRYPIHEN